MNKNIYCMADWSSEEPIAIVKHQMYDISHIINPSNIPQVSTKGIDVYRIDDMKSVMEAMESEKHCHKDFFELNFISAGSGTAFIDNEKFPIRKGDVLCISPDIFHVNIPVPQLTIQNCLISESMLKSNKQIFSYVFNNRDELALSPIIHMHGEDIPRTEKILDLINKELSEKQLYYREQTVNLTNELFVILSRAQQTTPLQKQFRGISNILTYIDDHFSTVTMSEAAALCGYNPTYFSRIFHETMGMKFTEYVNNIRVNNSIILLTTSELSIEQIGCSVGFKNKTHFYNVFKSHTGLLPGSLRQPVKKQI